MSQIDCGRQFHAFGPSTEKALEPIRVLVRGMSYSPKVAERRWAHPIEIRHRSDHVRNVFRCNAFYDEVHVLFNQKQVQSTLSITLSSTVPCQQTSKMSSWAWLFSFIFHWGFCKFMQSWLGCCHKSVTLNLCRDCISIYFYFIFVPFSGIQTKFRNSSRTELSK